MHIGGGGHAGGATSAGRGGGAHMRPSQGGMGGHSSCLIAGIGSGQSAKATAHVGGIWQPSGPITGGHNMGMLSGQFGGQKLGHSTVPIGSENEESKVNIDRVMS